MTVRYFCYSEGEKIWRRMSLEERFRNVEAWDEGGKALFNPYDFCYPVPRLLRDVDLFRINAV